MQLSEPKRLVMHIDLTAFFASAEQQANPFLRNKPMGVGNAGYRGSAIVAASYPAKAQGIGLATRYNEALRIDPTFELVNADFTKYFELHNRFINILRSYSPIVEIYSIDEAFLDFTHVRLGSRALMDICFEIKHRVTIEMGEAITCSIGIAPNKLLAKIGSNHDKPDGITFIKWEERLKYLDNLKLEDVWGIGRNVSKKMYDRGITTVKQLRSLSDAKLYSIVGGYYTRLRLLANGEHYEKVMPETHRKPAKSMQHAHTMSGSTTDKTKLKALARKMAERLAIRLRKNNQKAKDIFIGLTPEKRKTYGWDDFYQFKYYKKLPNYTDHGSDLYEVCAKYLDKTQIDLNIRRLTVGIFRLTTPDTISFADLVDEKIKKLDGAFDAINKRYGKFTIRTADILHEYAKESELSVDKQKMRFHTGAV